MRTLPIVCLALSTTLAACSKMPNLKFWDGDEPAVESGDPAFAQFGRFLGQWACSGSEWDGNAWRAEPGLHQWRWTTTLDGHAIQDYWTPSAESNEPLGVGTNLRIYNSQRERWEIVWTTAKQQEWDLIWAEEQAGKMVLHMQRPSRGDVKAHVARISFHNISDSHFDWKYEAAPLSDSRNFNEVYRLSCNRA